MEKTSILPRIRSYRQGICVEIANVYYVVLVPPSIPLLVVVLVWYRDRGVGGTSVYRYTVYYVLSYYLFLSYC